MKQLITIRQNEQAFDLQSDYKVHILSDRVVSVSLSAFTSAERIFALVNVSSYKQIVKIEKSIIEIQNTEIIDLVSGQKYSRKKDKDIFEINLYPYQVCWLKLNA